jgi:hypothetical protein
MPAHKRPLLDRVLDVFDAAGKSIAQMNAPPRRDRVYVRGNRLYLVATDSLDIQYVKAFQIVRR